MKIIKEINSCPNLNLDKKIRKASRAIIIINNKLLMIKSKKYNEYKFPGGGVKGDEHLKETLVREVLEETGYDVVVDTISEFGKVIESHLDSYSNSKIFETVSYYYLCKACNNGRPCNLDKYEKDYGYTPCLVDVDEAIKQNEMVKSTGPFWIGREIEVLKIIKKDNLLGKNC